MSHQTSPDPNQTGMPTGVPYIIGNELAERFSFYGMKGILTVFMTKHLLDSAGNDAGLGDEQAKTIYHLFTAGAYFFPLMGALLSDIWFGKYKTILWISLMYCVGHGSLALMDLGPVTGMWDMAPFLYLGLFLIAIGSGGIKPCVSAHVGDQFGKGNKHLLTQIFNWFYFAINVGAMASTILTPILLETQGPWAAFGLPGILMAIATFLFWLGRHSFVHVPPGGMAFVREVFGDDGRRALLNLAPLFLVFVPVFWSIFDQTGSAWVLQAESMNRQFLGITWLESQVQAVNPFFILVLIPVFTYVVYPAISRIFPLTPLRKIGIGFLLTAVTFSLSATIETWIIDGERPVMSELWEELGIAEMTQPESSAEVVNLAKALGVKEDQLAPAIDAMTSGGSEEEAAINQLWANVDVANAEMPANLSKLVKLAKTMGWEQGQLTPYLSAMPSIGWQFLAYIILTSAEILVSIVCLEFAYTQSPPKMKSLVMGVYLLGVSIGNFYVSGVNFALDLLKREDGTTLLEGANYYWFFVALMMIAFFGYLVWTRTYKGRVYIQGEDSDDSSSAVEVETPDAQ